MAGARRELLLGVHRHRLRREDLEDAYSQATLELLLAVRRGRVFASRLHLGRALEQRFVSRVHDRRRALSGRSPMQAALEQAFALSATEPEATGVIDVRSEPERVALLRHELRQIQTLAGALTTEQRMVLATQVGLQMGCEEFCRRYDWTSEKYRKVAQRGRARLKRLMALEEEVVPAGERVSEMAAGTDL
ncbi:MAG: hypothetical protein H0X28_10605 [Solirubrobacterales bacterium]|nr:hypothetical protein [Solirubrobacterales bacterium]